MASVKDRLGVSAEVIEDSGFIDYDSYYLAVDDDNDETPPDYGTMERICACPRPIYLRKSLPYVAREERKGPCNMTPGYCGSCGGLRAGPLDNPLCDRVPEEERRCRHCEGKGLQRITVDNVDNVDNDKGDTVDRVLCSQCCGRGQTVTIGADGSPISPITHTFDETNIRRPYLRSAQPISLPAMPEEERRFCTYKVEYIMKDIFERKLKHTKYDPASCSRLSHDLCTAIKERAKSMEFERYKLVVQVILGQDTEDSVQIASRCLWDQDTDNFAAATFRNSSIYAVGIVYGMYLD